MSPFTTLHLHRPHLNLHSPKEQTHPSECSYMVGTSFNTLHTLCSSDPIHKYPGLPSENINTADECGESATTSTAHAHSNKSTIPATSDFIRSSTDPTAFAKHDVSLCTEFATGSGTNLHAPNVSATSFISQGLTSTLRLRYCHPNT